MYEKITSGLDPEQKEAVASKGRRLLVVAPPGSGKTRVLASRFARLLFDGASPDEMLGITFTNRAADEMRRRVAELSGEPCGKARANIGTFHGFCLGFLKRRSPGFVLLGRAGQAAVLKDLGVKNPEKAAEAVSAAKNLSPPEGDCLDILNLYQAELKKRGALDIDDLILETINILEAPGGSIGAVFSHIMVDEFQDINSAQYRLVKLLTGPSSSLFAIGDPDQAIYGFRGSRLDCFLDFKDDYPDAVVIRLKNNYRSLGNIVRASAALIGNNKKRIDNQAEPVNGGGSIIAVRLPDERAEADFIVKEIEARMGGLTSLTAMDGCEDARFSDFAVLFRTNRQSEALLNAFLRSSIPCHIAGAKGPSLKDFIERLRMKTPPDGVPPCDFMEAEGRAMRLDDETLALLLGKARGLDAADIDGVLDEMLLLEPHDDIDIKADKVNLLTLHASKGLEFRNVFITGAEDGLIPLKLSGREEDAEEERRLFYVGITRAKERVYLLSAKRRRVRGAEEDCTPSPFLKEIPEKFLVIRDIDRKKGARRPLQKGLFE